MRCFKREGAACLVAFLLVGLVGCGEDPPEKESPDAGVVNDDATTKGDISEAVDSSTPADAGGEDSGPVDAGACAGGKTCDDDNPCTKDECDPDKGCVNTSAAGTCDDGDACTDKDACDAGQCVGSKTTCDDGDVCTDDACDPKTGCTKTPNTATCDDSDACTEKDVCADGKCAGAKIACDDGDVCTDDTCDAKTGCTTEHNAAACDDSDACTDKDTCAVGLCAGATITCDDKDVCTDDACDPKTGCTSKQNTADCDDADACTDKDVCAVGLCAGATITCDDKDVCTDDACDAKTGCTTKHNTAPCDDASACTDKDVCAVGLCAGATITCDDKDVCTDDSCDIKTGCTTKHNNASCDDASACTEKDMCAVGLCAGATIACDDKDVCTDDACDAKIGCTTKHNTAPCDDSDACTAKDTCGGGACKGAKVGCDDKNPCTADSCDKAKGCVYTADDKLKCDDGKPCTIDACASGKCKATVKVCAGHACAVGACDAKTGACGLKTAPAFSPCGDDRICLKGQCKLPWATSLSSSAQFNCVRRAGGKVACWGTGKEGQLGNGKLVAAPAGFVLGIQNARAVETGWAHACANLKDGRTVCWGRGTYGQIGHGLKPKVQPVPKLISGLPTATTYAAGDNHGCVLRGGAPYCFGRNSSRQTVRFTNSAQSKPAPMIDVAGLQGLSLGGSFSCGLRNGQVICWGNNLSGQTGRGYKSKTAFAAPVAGVKDAVQVSAGSVHACALHKGGTVSCWGSGANGRLGNGATATQSAPVPVKGLSGVIQISAGAFHTCALLATRKARCWGANKYGQLGSGDKLDRSAPKALAGSPGDIAELASGVWHSCARRRDGAILCWGFSSVGELGLSKKGTFTKAQVMPGTGAKAPAACKQASDCGASGPCFAWACDAATSLCVSQLKPDKASCDDGDKCTKAMMCKAGRCVGKPKCADAKFCTNDLCRGDNGQCAYGNNSALCNDGNACTTYDRCKSGKCGGPVKTCNDGNSCTTESCDPKNGGCATKTASDGANCSDGSKCTTKDACKGGVCKAGGAAGPCPDDGNPCTLAVCDPTSGCQQVVAATGTSCGGEMICASGACAMPWGKSVAAGRDYTCALRPGGTVSCWGRNQLGQLGRGKASALAYDMAAATGLAGVVQLDAGLYHACGTKADGKVACWGYNKWGQVGSGKAGGIYSSRVNVAGPGDLVAVRAGYNYTCARRATGSLLCWGDGASYQFNSSNNIPWLKPKPLPQVPQMKDLATANVTTCAVSQAGTVHCWGFNSSGATGQGNYTKLVSAKPVFGNWKASRVVAGISHGCALLVDGRVACWGNNKYGQLGNGSLATSNKPVPVSLIDDAVDITAGAYHNCVLRKGGAAWCWGRNDRGQVAQTITAPRRWPMPTGGPKMRSISAGYLHTCAISTSGTLYCWGSSKYGEIAMGKTSWGWTPFLKMIKGTTPAPAKSCQSDGDCGAKGPCYTAKCTNGICVPAPAQDGKTCDDGSACSVKDACAGGKCQGLDKCNDGNDCTLDSCASAGGACKNAAVAGWCDDGDNCTTKNFCKGGKCAGATKTVCNDNQACTVDSCDPTTGKCVFIPKAGAPGCNAGSVIRGTITFSWVPALDTSEGGPGLGYAKGKDKPARRIEVLGLYKGAVVASTRTNDKGEYALSVPAGLEVKVRATARLVATGDAADGIAPDACKGAWFDVRVVDNTNDKSLYAIESPVGFKAPKDGVNLHAPVAWSNGLYQKRAGAPFAVLDTALQTIETVCQGEAKVKLPLLLFNWSVNNNPNSGDKTKGDMGPAAHFTVEKGIPSVYLRGKENVDTDEYDDHTVAHEFGHYLERFLFRSDGIGGAHSFGQILNPRTAFAEGYGNGLSAIVWADPIYVSTSGKNQKGGFVVDFSMPGSGDDRSVHSEGSVANFLYNLWDARDAKPASGSFDRIYQVLKTCQVTTPALTSLHSFAGCYNAMFGGAADGFKTLWETTIDSPYDALCAGSCSGKGDVTDPWDVDNDLGKHYAQKLAYPEYSATFYDVEFWRIYRTLKSGTNASTGHEKTRRAYYKGAFNKQGGVRMYRYLGTGAKTTIAVTKPIGAACSVNTLDMVIRQGNKVVGGDYTNSGPTPGCPAVTFAAAPGTWYTITVRLPTSKDAAKDLNGWQMVVKP